MLCFILIDWSLGYLPNFKTWNVIFNKIQPNIGKKNIKYFLNNRLDESTRIIPHPYMSYINRPNYINEIGIKETNNLGYRNSENYYSIFDSTDSSVKVLIIGGSTTWGYYIHDPSYTWSAKLELLLTKFYPGKVIQVINAGILYGTTAELLSHYIYKNRYLNPDIVIIHTGGNDVVPLLFHDYKPDYSEFRNINFDLHSLRRGELFLIKNSAHLLFVAMV